MVKQGTLLNQK